MTARAADIAIRFSGRHPQRALIDALSRQLIFEGNTHAIQAIANNAEIIPVDSGEVIITQGASDTNIYFILSGSLIVSPNGRDDTIRSAGTYVGEMAAIDPAALRSATARAKEPTVLAKLSEPDFTTVAQAHPFIWRHLAREMADRLRQRAAKVPVRVQQSRVFIGSTREALNLAQALQSQLAVHSIPASIWTDRIFTPGLTNIEALEAEVVRADFAALVLSPDDEVISRGATSAAPRDNLLYELGLFTGAIGRLRTIMIQPHGVDLKIPSDLLGVTPIKFSDNDMISVGSEFARIVRDLGPK
jgi:CRP/FNR family transcriptional regulator, cyclic AMP receptor protein